MCLGIPGQVVEIVDGYAGQLALVDVGAPSGSVNIGMLDDQPPPPGDWVLHPHGLRGRASIDGTGAERRWPGWS